MAGIQDLEGNYLNNAPKWSFNLTGAYSTKPMSIGAFTFRGDFSYRSRVYFREFNLPLDSQDPYAIINLALIWDSPDESISARLYANNLTDKAYITRLGSSDNVGARFVTYGIPRQIGLELKKKF